MKKLLFITILITASNQFVLAQENHTVISVSRDIEITKLSDHVYIHTTYADMLPFGRVPSNGLIFVNIEKAFLFDTPTNDTLTEELVKWIEGKLKAEVLGVIPNHWHIDCMGGLKYMHRHGVHSFAYDLTRKIAAENKLPVPSKGFSDSLVFKLGKEKVISKYFGAAHSKDNIVTWIPSEKILFTGCMVKELRATSLGNTADGDINEWPKTLQKIIDAYPDAKIVIPGHGEYGGLELVRHTLELLKNGRELH